jgi:HEAT repeat protein
MENKAEAGANAAAYGLGILGTSAKAALPELCKLLDDPKFPQCRSRTLFALCNLGKEGLAVVISRLDSTDTSIRMSAVLAICYSGIGTNAALAVPGLIQILEHDQGSAAVVAAKTLGELYIEPEIVVPALTNCLRGTDSPSPIMKSRQKMAIFALGKFGSKAQSAVPLLLKMAYGPNGGNYWAATNALGKIAPEVLPAAVRKEQ